MTRTKSEHASVLRWWNDANVIDTHVSGVFEGGGAKGVLYAGALEGMVAERCWFDAVAGASAGAITATLIAAGMRPDQIRKRMDKALATLRLPTPLNGALRVRDGASYLNQDALLTWLRQMLEASFRLRGRTRGKAGATFAELYELTEIELHVVAVDLNRHQLVVFNHRLTPTCQVAEAVVGSAAIPFAFECRRLILPGLRQSLIVDGGIAANFPRFVFTDRSFRHWAGLPDLDDTLVVGFLLDEKETSHNETPSVYYHGSAFDPGQGGSRNRKFRAAKIANNDEVSGDAVAHSAMSRVAKVVVFPFRILLWPLTHFFFNLFPWLLAANGRDRGNPALAGDPSWLTAADRTKPPPDTETGPSPNSAEPGRSSQGRPVAIASRVARGFPLFLDRIVLGTRPLLFFLGALFVVSLSLGAGLYHYGWQPLIDVFNDAVNGKVSIFGMIISVIVLLLVISCALYSWIVLVVLFVTTYFTYATTRTIGYGLLKTFLQGAGAPPWAGHHPDDHVIRLAVPETMTTLQASLPEDLIASALATAQKDTRSTIRAIRDTDRNRTFALSDATSRTNKRPST